MVKATPAEGTSALKTALECAYELLLQKIISNPHDMMGILLFGTVLPTPQPVLSVGKNKSRRKLFPPLQSHGPRRPRRSLNKRTKTSPKRYPPPPPPLSPTYSVANGCQTTTPSTPSAPP